MKVLIIAAVVIIALAVITVVAIMIIGWRLPAAHTVSRSIQLRQPPENAYSVVRDFASAPEWRSDVHIVQIVDDDSGKILFRETGHNGTINYQLDEVYAS